MKYIHVGTNKLMDEYFYPILNSPKVIKPTGGLWSSNNFSATFNEWMDYIIGKPFYYSNYVTRENPFKLDCVVVSLSDASSILDISAKEGFQELTEKYKFDFERLEEDYDGIYFDPYKMFATSPKDRVEFSRVYSVKTLCLFDMANVKEYKKGLIVVDPFDYTDSYNYDVPYEMLASKGSYQVESVSEEYKDLLDLMYRELKDFIYHLRLKYPDYPSAQLVSIIKEEMNKVLGSAIVDYAKQKQMNEERITNSLAIRTLKKVK
jgi:hypothetical protein